MAGGGQLGAEGFKKVEQAAVFRDIGCSFPGRGVGFGFFWQLHGEWFEAFDYFAGVVGEAYYREFVTCEAEVFIFDQVIENGAYTMDGDIGQDTVG